MTSSIESEKISDSLSDKLWDINDAFVKMPEFFLRHYGILLIVEESVGAFMRSIRTDIYITPVNQSMTRERWIWGLTHEFGHLLGLRDTDTGISVMRQNGAYISPTKEDLDEVASIYPACQSSLRLTLSPYPAPFVRGICTGSAEPSHWQIGATLTNRGNAGVTLSAYDVEYFASGISVGTSTNNPLGMLQGAKGFPPLDPNNLHINAGQSMRGILCQVRWRPEELQSLKMVVKGTDENGKAVQASDTITFEARPMFH